MTVLVQSLLNIIVALPDVRTIAGRDLTWIALGLSEADCRGLQHGDGSDANSEAEICRRLGEATIIKIQTVDGRPIKATVWKGISGHEIFYAVRRDGTVLIADHFRNILSQLPVSERMPSDAALVDHFLYRTLPVDVTYCSGVERLRRGERLSIDIASGDVETTTFDRIDVVAEPRTIDEYLDRIDEVLATALEPCKSERDIACLFSGGVDSTLVQTYLPQIPPLTLVLPQYDHKFETEYASRVAALLDLKLKRCFVDEADYLQKLERAIDATGLPPPHLQFAFYQELFRPELRTFVMGEIADTIFGLSGRIAKVASYFTSPAGLFLLQQVASHAPRMLRNRWRGLFPLASRLREAPTSPFGYGAQVDVYTEYPLINAAFGPKVVRDRLAHRMNFMLERCRPTVPADDPFLQHIEIAQLITFFCSDTPMSFRHLAHANGKTLVMPFLAKRMFEVAFSVPATERFIRGLRSKYLLKELLERRLPGYDVNQRKGYTHVSFERYYKTGPLSRIWEHYAVPDLFEGAVREEIMAQPSQTSWNAITLAVWEERVRRNADLKPLPHSRIFTWEPAVAGGESADDESRFATLKTAGSSAD